MESNNFDNNNTNDEKINAFIGVKKKSFKKLIILAISLVIVGFVLVMILAFSFVGEDGYIREDAPGEWLFVALIPLILGLIIFLIPIFSVKKNMGSYQNPGRTSEISPEQSNRALEHSLKSLNKGKFILIMITVVFIGLLIILVIMGKLSLEELIDAIF
ncbi:MAG: hypothetical protein ACTSPA_07465 [Promethearchaeota archaeon]